MMNRKSQLKQGITLVEVVLYVGLLAFLTIIVFSSSISMNTTYRVITTLSDISSSAVISLERFTREVRDSVSVDTGASTFDSSPGVLVVNSPLSGGGTQTLTFSIGGSNQLMLQKGSGSPAPLTPDHLEVSNLVFTFASSTNSEAVRIEMTIENTIGVRTISQNFYDFVILKGSY